MRQRIRPKPVAKAITSPSSRPGGRLLLHGGLFMKDWKTVCPETAGVEATQRPDLKRHARLPVFALTANRTPELFVK